MSDGDWGHALWLSALAALAALCGLGGLGGAIVLGTDASSRPDSTLDWNLYTYGLLPLALVFCAILLRVAVRLYSRAFQIYFRTRR
jgi:ABC-type proline/glycine betaine transport system permease subunit